MKRILFALALCFSCVAFAGGPAPQISTTAEVNAALALKANIPVSILQGGTGATTASAATTALLGANLRVKILIGTTPAAGATGYIAHGVATWANILSVSAMVDVNGSGFITPDDSIDGAGTLYNVGVYQGDITVALGGSATSIGNKPIKIAVLYTE